MYDFFIMKIDFYHLKHLIKIDLYLFLKLSSLFEKNESESFFPQKFIF